MIQCPILCLKVGQSLQVSYKSNLLGGFTTQPGLVCTAIGTELSFTGTSLVLLDLLSDLPGTSTCGLDFLSTSINQIHMGNFAYIASKLSN